ncbi:MAG: hypothetical protein ABIR70_15910 [Bryobacteraceae bacterium]
MKLFALLFLALPLAAQPLSVYSEFARIDAKGKVTAPAEPREILSPALARNAFASFQIVVEPSDAALPWQLYVAQNPENAVQVTLYRESGDRLEKATQPISGTGTQVFWIDIYTARNAPVERIKVEPQLHINNDWVIYPMEGRIMDAIIPDPPTGGWPQGIAAPADVMRGFVCGTQFTAGVAPKDPTQATLRFRNAQQDRALAGKAAKPELQERFGACDAVPPADNPEWYHRVRDFLFRLK